ncbi:MAG: MFS transporter, partial [Rhodospirillales bacterium]|nr:MFS transporter [Rhodospirillales bacterium]
MSVPVSSARLTLVFSCIGHAYAHLFVLLYATAVLVIEREFNLPYADLIWLSVPGFVMFGLGAIPAGWLADRWSGAGMLAVYFLGLGGASIVTGLANSTWGLLVGLTLIGTFASIYHPVGIALVVAGAKSRGRALGINGVFGNVGTALGALVAGLLADTYGWRAAFLAPGGVALATGLVFAIVVSRGAIADGRVDITRHEEPSSVDRRRGIVFLAFTTLCAGLVFNATSVGLPKLFSERLSDFAGEGALGVGALVSIVYLVSTLGQVVGGELADRFTLKWVYLGGHLLQMPAILIAIVSHNMVLVAAAAMMATMNLGAQPAENALVARLTPLAWRARAFGVKFVIT